jgi:hypothetical protein
MSWLQSIDTKDWLMIVSTMLGPILAVQAQKAIERWRSQRDTRMRIFYALMATRALKIAPERVEALNRIDLEFLSGRPWQWSANAKSRAVRDAWEAHSYKLNVDVSKMNEAEFTHWDKSADETFFDLLHKISLSLGFEFTQTQLKKGAYYPDGHVLRERFQNMVLEGAARVLSGERPLKMDIEKFPFQPVSEDPATR